MYQHIQSKNRLAIIISIICITTSLFAGIPSASAKDNNQIELGNVDLTLYRISNTSGTANSSNPGTAKSSFYRGETVRVTLRAINTGASVPILSV